ncbi:MAG: aspartate aminotransferase family protein [Planctomycetes bacterium]|nr:aspartate aminotransferase family protein [Planctomycetota bacterium]
MERLAEFPAYSRLALDPVAAAGSTLATADGAGLLDLYGGHCVNSLGAGDPGLGEALAEQWRRLSFTTNLLPLAERGAFLAALAVGMPPGEWRAFCSNSGAEANENALKIALAATGRRRVVCFEGAFHGRTAAAAAVSDNARPAFPADPFHVRRLPWGRCEGIDGSVGAVILEPIQSLAGVVEPPAGFLESLRAACDASGALLVFDEVQTGSGRLGAPWASSHYGVVPDLFTTAKGAGGGFPIGLSFATAEVAAATPAGLLGSTFGGGPMALRAATEVARRVSAPVFLEQVRAVSAVLRGAAGRGPVTAVRGVGLLLGLVTGAGVPARALRDALLARGILTGCCDDPQVLRLCPPLNLGLEQAESLLTALDSITLPAAAPASS